MDFQKGDWVVSYKPRWDHSLRANVETDPQVCRVWRRTKTQIKLEPFGIPYRKTPDGWQGNMGYFGDARFLRAATPAEVAQGEVAERAEQERVKALAEQADRFRDRLRAHDWASVSDTDVRWVARQLGWKDAE